MDVSALGFSILVKDTKLFPQGFLIKRTADGADPFDFPDITIGESTMDANGFIVYASTPTPLGFDINLLPTSEEDNNMSMLFESHRSAAGRARTGGKISITVQYADGSSITATDVYINGGSPAKSIQSPSRYKNKNYKFTCQDYLRG
jgi:hypothetical protein